MPHTSSDTMFMICTWQYVSPCALSSLFLTCMTLPIQCIPCRVSHHPPLLTVWVNSWGAVCVDLNETKINGKLFWNIHNTFVLQAHKHYYIDCAVIVLSSLSCQLALPDEHLPSPQVELAMSWVDCLYRSQTHPATDSSAAHSTSQGLSVDLTQYSRAQVAWNSVLVQPFSSEMPCHP